MAISVKIADLRNRLSDYLRKVRKGHEVVISDRETPIARLIPFDRPVAKSALDILEPPKGYEGLSKLNFPPLSRPVHATEELLAERRRR